MIEIGKKQCLNVVKKTDFGVYLGSEEEKVLLPKKQVPEEIEIGDALTVFIYRDSSDRLIATVNEPAFLLGELAVLKVVQTGEVGAFLDWGLEKDLFLPYKEQTKKVEPGDECLVALYLDKSSRLCATMRIYEYLETGSRYVKDSHVSGTVFDVNPEYGAFVAVDNQYIGLIQKNEMFGDIQPCSHVEARVSQVRPDGKLMLSLKQKAYIQMDEDSTAIYKAIEENGGRLPFNDKADAELIKSRFNMSKNAFKRAVGRLLKENKIVILENSIEKSDKE